MKFSPSSTSLSDSNTGRSARSKTFVSRYHDTDITHALTQPTQIVLFIRVHAKPTDGMEIATTDSPMYIFIEPYCLNTLSRQFPRESGSSAFQQDAKCIKDEIM
ncbi:uncharacterized protein EAF02_001492 [Botrytis sinoallii]|uniref:uncharacterized protein n=1 Tax=Botrytis sinoallii TaxID=1463999 RepID=UPI0019020CDF|nr:uncharacterized protein EAF02_001492 [Botrytis sinoallii]KAF7891167.1 hypothetical protein EAF02_001492 [Botrytis sinoallii]